MHKFPRYRAALIIPAIASLLVLSAGQAWADEGLPVPAGQVKKLTKQAYDAGVKQGKRQMHDQMMHDHQMGMTASGGMQMGCGGKAGCKDGMPMGPKAKQNPAPPAADKPAMPMNDDM